MVAAVRSNRYRRNTAQEKILATAGRRAGSRPSAIAGRGRPIGVQRDAAHERTSGTAMNELVALDRAMDPITPRPRESPWERRRPTSPSEMDISEGQQENMADQQAPERRRSPGLPGGHLVAPGARRGAKLAAERAEHDCAHQQEAGRDQ
jgi:hypothetical protein